MSFYIRNIESIFCRYKCPRSIIKNKSIFYFTTTKFNCIFYYNFLFVVI